MFEMGVFFTCFFVIRFLLSQTLEARNDAFLVRTQSGLLVVQLIRLEAQAFKGARDRRTQVLHARDLFLELLAGILQLAV